jgi:hypothetical protein
MCASCTNSVPDKGWFTTHRAHVAASTLVQAQGPTAARNERRVGGCAASRQAPGVAAAAAAAAEAVAAPPHNGGAPASKEAATRRSVPSTPCVSPSLPHASLAHLNWPFRMYSLDPVEGRGEMGPGRGRGCDSVSLKCQAPALAATVSRCWTVAVHACRASRASRAAASLPLPWQPCALSPCLIPVPRGSRTPCPTAPLRTPSPRPTPPPPVMVTVLRIRFRPRVEFSSYSKSYRSAPPALVRCDSATSCTSSVDSCRVGWGGVGWGGFGWVGVGWGGMWLWRRWHVAEVACPWFSNASPAPSSPCHEHCPPRSAPSVCGGCRNMRVAAAVSNPPPSCPSPPFNGFSQRGEEAMQPVLFPTLCRGPSCLCLQDGSSWRAREARTFLASVSSSRCPTASSEPNCWMLSTRTGLTVTPTLVELWGARARVHTLSSSRGRQGCQRPAAVRTRRSPAPLQRI